MFNNQPYYPMPQGPAFQRPAFQQPMMYPQQMQPAPQPVVQDNTPQVRFVASREEAVASTVIPGMPCIMINRVDGEIYFKAIDVQTGVPIFEDYAKKQPVQQQAPQYVTIDALEALRNEFEQILEQRINAITAPKSSPRKVVNSNDE